MSIRIVYPELPPTSNLIYFRGTMLTSKAREYAERFAHYVVKNHLHEISSLNPEGLYELTLHFYFNLLTSSYNNPKVPVSKRAKSRYKKVDLSNRVKLLEDCVRDALNVDDSRTLEIHLTKFHDPVSERVEIYINEVDPLLYGIPKEEPMA